MGLFFKIAWKTSWDAPFLAFGVHGVRHLYGTRYARFEQIKLAAQVQYGCILHVEALIRERLR